MQKLFNEAFEIEYSSGIVVGQNFFAISSYQSCKMSEGIKKMINYVGKFYAFSVYS